MSVVPFPTNRIVNEQLVTKKQLAASLGYSTRWVELRVREGMPSVVIGNRRRFRISEVMRWLESR
jgi:phage terminase Nu1 subunit (DNA packaging protein)